MINLFFHFTCVSSVISRVMYAKRIWQKFHIMTYQDRNFWPVYLYATSEWKHRDGSRVETMTLFPCFTILNGLYLIGTIKKIKYINIWMWKLANFGPSSEYQKFYYAKYYHVVYQSKANDNKNNKNISCPLPCTQKIEYASFFLEILFYSTVKFEFTSES